MKNFEEVAENNGNLLGLPIHNSGDRDLHLLLVPVARSLSRGKTDMGVSLNNIIKESTQVEVFNVRYPHLTSDGKYPKVNTTKLYRGTWESDKSEDSYLSMTDTLAIEVSKSSCPVGMVGGDHSTPLGCILGVSEKYSHEKIYLIHIDAHLDLRESLDGDKWSHASIMHNVLSMTENIKIVQFGARDFSESEYKFAKSSLNHEIATSLDSIYTHIPLDAKVYISLDIDGLDIQYCPNTGTPVPGGFSYNDIVKFIWSISKDYNIIGFDLVEVGLGEVDQIVASRLLYELSLATIS